MGNHFQNDFSNPVTEVTFLLEGQQLKVTKRLAWMLNLLKERGEKGVTTIEVPGVRMSHYVMMLRRLNLAIETVDVEHPGPFKGTHGKYILRSPVTFLKVVRAMDKGAANAA
ncbi:hypothetical protein KBI52_12285 [Microvirga sp. HBU67558]|uniref:winged helix domain-containing protein n=1 Tax=Microvirga sp. HBU67558 TaxID=2824562 RepID=UPI001B35B75B|nr:hypothetical protein [Microvirga sp. HBU67558]MBQ0820985.1 hypothetical protein [Microvirga sp. HBU67558]